MRAYDWAYGALEVENKVMLKLGGHWILEKTEAGIQFLKNQSDKESGIKGGFPATNEQWHQALAKWDLYSHALTSSYNDGMGQTDRGQSLWNQPTDSSAADAIDRPFNPGSVDPNAPSASLNAPVAIPAKGVVVSQGIGPAAPVHYPTQGHQPKGIGPD